MFTYLFLRDDIGDCCSPICNKILRYNLPYGLASHFGLLRDNTRVVLKGENKILRCNLGFGIALHFDIYINIYILVSL